MSDEIQPQPQIFGIGSDREAVSHDGDKGDVQILLNKEEHNGVLAQKRYRWHGIAMVV